MIQTLTLTKLALFGAAAILIPLTLAILCLVYFLNSGRSRVKEIKAVHGKKVHLLQDWDSLLGEAKNLGDYQKDCEATEEPQFILN